MAKRSRGKEFGEGLVQAHEADRRWLWGIAVLILLGAARLLYSMGAS